MKTPSIKIEYSENCLQAMQTTHDGFEHEARMAMAIKLFEMKRLPSSMAAQLVGIDRVSFLMELNQYNTPMQDLALEELKSDLANA